MGAAAMKIFNIFLGNEISSKKTVPNGGSVLCDLTCHPALPSADKILCTTVTSFVLMISIHKQSHLDGTRELFHTGRIVLLQ